MMAGQPQTLANPVGHVTITTLLMHKVRKVEGNQVAPEQLGEGRAGKSQVEEGS